MATKRKSTKKKVNSPGTRFDRLRPPPKKKRKK